MRTGWNSQEVPIFTRMLDKDSNWNKNNGLATLIPTLLHFSLIGYPFVLPGDLILCKNLIFMDHNFTLLVNRHDWWQWLRHCARQRIVYSLDAGQCLYAFYAIQLHTLGLHR